MTVLEALLELCKRTINDSNDWYSWRKINEKKLPSGITLPCGNHYEQNVYLKTALRNKWVKSDDAGKVEIVCYYISTWGGIHKNSEETIQRYSNATPENLIALGIQGVASWSKALCVYNPIKYAIFDARVSASINSLQIIYGINSPSLYPVLSSRNKTIVKANSMFKQKAMLEGWTKKAESEYYSDYLNLLKSVKHNLNGRGVEIYTIEMLLFSKAEELIKKAFPSEKF
jgi:hypothetical protein